MRRMALSQVTYIIGWLSITLLAISLWGVYVDPYHDYKEKYHLQNPSSLYKILDISFYNNGLSDKFISDFINTIGTVVRYDWPDDIDYMPMQENWILNFLKLIDPLVSKYLLRDPKTLLFQKVELPDYKRALSRGFGICSQLSLGTADLLYKRYGIDARVAGLNGHVVVQVFGITGKNFIIDPSFGVFTTGHVLRTDLIDPSYMNMIKKVEILYLTRGDNYISKIAGWAAYSENSTTRQTFLFYFVIFSYYLKWLIPIFGLAFSMFLNRSKIFRTRCVE